MPPVVTFPFDRDFQINVLALMLKRVDFLLTCVELFQPEYFEDKILVWFFNVIKQHYTLYQDCPGIDPVLTNEMIKATRSKLIKPTEISDYAAVVAKLRQPVLNSGYTIDEVIRFCRRQAGRKLWLETAPLMDTADDAAWDQIVNRITQIPVIGMNHLNLGVDYFGTFQTRITQRISGNSNKITIPVGISELDTLIGGGLKTGQLGLWLGGTGRGKSIALVHCGKIAVEWGYKVAHYSLELDEDDIAERYDSTLTQIPVTNLSTHITEFARKSKYLHDKHKGRLQIKHYPTGSASVNTIKQHLRQMEATGWVPDLVIVDYGDLLKPLTSYSDEYADLGATFMALRGLAGELGVPLWSATQSNRVGIVSDVIDIEHIGDSIKKAQISDIIIALCASREEIQRGVIRLFGAKNRNGVDKFELTIRTAYDKMTLHDLLAPTVAQVLATGSGPPPTGLTAPQSAAPKRRAAKPLTRV